MTLGILTKVISRVFHRPLREVLHVTERRAQVVRYHVEKLPHLRVQLVALRRHAGERLSQTLLVEIAHFFEGRGMMSR